MHIWRAIAYVYARYTHDDKNSYWRDYWFDDAADKRRMFASVLQFIYPIATWISVRYRYHMQFNLLLHTTVKVIEPINFLCTFIRPGVNFFKNILLMY